METKMVSKYITDYFQTYPLLTIFWTPWRTGKTITCLAGPIHIMFKLGYVHNNYKHRFVDCAICGNAELLVTNDAHFDILRTIEFPKVEIIRLQEYVKLGR